MTATAIRWTRKALRELEALLAPVANDDPALTVAIAERIDAAVKRLGSFPSSAPYFGLGLRRLSVPHLPYSCYYRFTNGAVHIIAVRHNKQAPMQ